MTELARRGNRGRPQSIDLDDDEPEADDAGNSFGGRRVWSFSQTSLAKEAEDFQTVNPLHSPQFGEEEGGEKAVVAFLRHFG